MLGWLLNIALLEDRFIIILFSLFKFGIIRTKSERFSGLSMVVGFWKIELQINLSIVQSIKIKLNEYEAGRA